jgi:hypothetical protein
VSITQYRYGIPTIAVLSLIAWLALGGANICGFIDWGVDAPPDARHYGCDNTFTRVLRDLAGDRYRSPSYDFVYDPYLSYVWLFGIGFAIWYAFRSIRLRRLRLLAGE